MIYQHPLAYLIGLEGLALLRGWAGEFDEEFVTARLAEVRRLVNDPAWADHPGVRVRRGDPVTGYRQWAPQYDEGRNTLFDSDEPVMHEILDALPPGTALDAGCGTGRYAAHLAAHGHRVLGVDSSPDMLGRARSRVPDGEFLIGDLDRLPVPDDAVDVVVSGLAVSHLPDLGPVMAELARVVRPGGHVVVSDAHHEQIFRGSVVKAVGPAGEPGLVATYRHTPGDFLRAALAAGLEVRRCEEPRPTADDRPVTDRPQNTPGTWETWPWSLTEAVPEAARAAWWTPSTIVWHFQRAGS
jgi:SAM-dependent methyltransferase